MGEENTIRLNLKEIERLLEVAKNTYGVIVFEVSTKATGIGEVVEVTIKVSDKEKRVIDITDYDSW